MFLPRLQLLLRDNVLRRHVKNAAAEKRRQVSYFHTPASQLYSSISSALASGLYANAAPLVATLATTTRTALVFVGPRRQNINSTAILRRLTIDCGDLCRR